MLMILFKILHYFALIIGIVFTLVMMIDYFMLHLNSKKEKTIFTINLEFFILTCMWYFMVYTIIKYLAELI